MTSIQHVQLSDTPLSVLQDTAVKALRRYLNDGGTDDLRKVAVCLVDSREHFITTEGEPDWKGNSNAYRQWSRATYDRAGVPRDRLSSVQAAVRYHVSIVIREKLDPDTLSDLGLLDQSSRQRSAQRHATTYDLAGLFGQGGRIVDIEQIAAAVKAMTTTLRRIDIVTAAASDPEAVTQLVPQALELQLRVDELAQYARTFVSEDLEFTNIPGWKVAESGELAFERASRAMEQMLEHPDAYTSEQLVRLAKDVKILAAVRETPPGKRIDARAESTE